MFIDGGPCASSDGVSCDAVLHRILKASLSHRAPNGVAQAMEIGYVSKVDWRRPSGLPKPFAEVAARLIFPKFQGRPKRQLSLCLHRFCVFQESQADQLGMNWNLPDPIGVLRRHVLAFVCDAKGRGLGIGCDVLGAKLRQFGDRRPREQPQ